LEKRMTLLLSTSLGSSQVRRRVVSTFMALGIALGVAAFTPPVYAQASAAKPSPQVSVKTSMGEIVIELYPDKAPKTVANFMAYVNDGHYSGTIFHRVITNFMIQGGGLTRNMTQKPTKPPVQIESQNGLKNDIGWVAMARTSAPDSATSQFFINTVENRTLDFPAPDGHGYTVFGKVVKGMDVVTKIRGVPTISTGPYRDVPAEPVIIDSISPLSAK
jgi:peptidyl-prolyl cis-trans isomerase A (cyclophilin A)